jgi:hypothetical protein
LKTVLITATDVERTPITTPTWSAVLVLASTADATADQLLFFAIAFLGN